jgi:hypothetical protein
VVVVQTHSNGAVLDDEILADAEVMEAIKSEGSVHRSYPIYNTDRATLGRLGGAIARLHGDSGFAGTVSIDLKVICPPNPRALFSLTCLPATVRKVVGKFTQLIRPQRVFTRTAL